MGQSARRGPKDEPIGGPTVGRRSRVARLERPGDEEPTGGTSDRNGMARRRGREFDIGGRRVEGLNI